MTFIPDPEEWLDLKIGSSIERAETADRWHRDFSFPILARFKDRNFDWKRRNEKNFELGFPGMMKLDGLKNEERTSIG